MGGCVLDHGCRRRGASQLPGQAGLQPDAARPLDLEFARNYFQLSKWACHAVDGSRRCADGDDVVDTLEVARPCTGIFVRASGWVVPLVFRGALPIRHPCWLNGIAGVGCGDWNHLQKHLDLSQPLYVKT